MFWKKTNKKKFKVIKKVNFVDIILENIRLNKIKKYIPKNSILLDVGCSYRFKLLKTLKKKIKKGYGIDLEVNNHRQDNLVFFNIDITKNKIPLKNNSIDIIVMLAVIEHIVNPTNILSEMHRILKKNGTLLLTTPSPKSKPILEFGAKFGIFNKKEIFDHKLYYNKKKLFKVLKAANFKIIKYEYFQFGLNQAAICKK